MVSVSASAVAAAVADEEFEEEDEEDEEATYRSDISCNFKIQAKPLRLLFRLLQKKFFFLPFFSFCL